jgi:hypothetical protein
LLNSIGVESQLASRFQRFLHVVFSNSIFIPGETNVQRRFRGDEPHACPQMVNKPETGLPLPPVHGFRVS